MKQLIRKLRNDYVIHQVQQVSLPELPSAPVSRWRIHFTGRVQKVGFRLEVCLLAERLGLTGFCQNLLDGTVTAELQGAWERVAFVVSFMESLKRIRIDGKTVEEIPTVPGETGCRRC